MKQIRLLPNDYVQRIEKILVLSWRILKTSVLNSITEEVCLALHIPLTAIAKDQESIVSVSTSSSKLIVPLKSRDMLERIEPDFKMIWNLCENYNTIGFYPFAKQATGTTNSYLARQFPKRAGYNEDPATGVYPSCEVPVYFAELSSYFLRFLKFTGKRSDILLTG